MYKFLGLSSAHWALSLLQRKGHVLPTKGLTLTLIGFVIVATEGPCTSTKGRRLSLLRQKAHVLPTKGHCLCCIIQNQCRAS